MKPKSLKLNAFLNSLRGVLNLIFPLITFPYVSRVLSVSGIGKYTYGNLDVRSWGSENEKLIIGDFCSIANTGLSSCWI